MSIVKKSFGKNEDGKEVSCYILDNGQGLWAEILDYGCIVRSLYTKDKNGNELDVVLGRDSVEEYASNSGYYGAVIGRNSNRIGNRITINGQECIFAQNNGKNNLHGGLKGFDKKLWDVQIIDTEGEPSILLSATSPDGEEGFPGEVKVQVTYTLTKENSLKLHYSAVSSKETIINLTNHSYFNLNGHNSGTTIDNHDLQLNCSYFTPNTAECVPNGEILSVKNTPFDFTEAKQVGKDINSTDCEQLAMFEGYDHNFIIDGTGFRKGGELYSSESGICMEFYTNSPAVQLYTGNSIHEDVVCKDGELYKKHGALCLETQFFPNSFAYSHFVKPIFKAGEKFDYTTEYIFSIK